MLTHEEWVNGGSVWVFFCARPPRQPRARYQPVLMLTHEEWVNGGRYESFFARGRPANPARDTNPS
jgi:hypothetical protein